MEDLYKNLFFVTLRSRTHAFYEISMKYSLILSLFAFSCIFLPSCKRSTSEWVDDSRTAGRYLKKSFKSLGGKGGESRQFRSLKEIDKGSVGEEEYVSLNEEDLYQKILLGDSQTLSKLHPAASVPASREDPGAPGSAIPAIESFLTPEQMQLNHLFSFIHFDTNSERIYEEREVEILRQVAQFVLQQPDLYLFVEGHCDKRGTSKYNLALGLRRANAVRVFLIKEGVHPDHIFTISYGKERPIALGESKEDLRLNRRCEFKLYDRKDLAN